MIFAISDSDKPRATTDWVMAPTYEEAIDFYKRYAGYWDPSESHITVVEEDTWHNCYILDVFQYEPDGGVYDESLYCNGYLIEESFADYARRHEDGHTDIICTNNF